MIDDVFQSEMATNANNRALAMRLVATGRFNSIKEGEYALENYTKACAIGVTPKELATAAVVLARGGRRGDKQCHEFVRTVRAYR